MMGIERRKGKDKPVITKYLVELDGPMYNAYLAVKELWGKYDCYVSPGPVQFDDPLSIDVPFIVRAPEPQFLLKEAEARAKFEESVGEGAPHWPASEHSMSAVALKRTKQLAELPSMLESGDFRVVGIKRPDTHLLEDEHKIEEDFRCLPGNVESNSFVELVPRREVELLGAVSNDKQITDLNSRIAGRLAKKDKLRIGLVYVGR